MSMVVSRGLSFVSNAARRGDFQLAGELCRERSFDEFRIIRGTNHLALPCRHGNMVRPGRSIDQGNADDAPAGRLHHERDDRAEQNKEQR